MRVLNGLQTCTNSLSRASVESRASSQKSVMRTPRTSSMTK